MQKTESAGGIVMNVEGEIALVKNGPNFWGFPKGHIDPGEDALTAAKREIAEESGLTDIVLVRDLGAYERAGGLDMAELKTIYMFLFTTDEVVLAPSDSSNPEARWVPVREVEEMLTNPKDREFFASVATGLLSR